MPRSRHFAAIAMLAAAFAAYAQSKGAQTITVSDAKSLVNAIASDRTIVLKKGDYLLSSAYGVKTKTATWIDGDDGKELQLTQLQNVTIRGADGARIVSDAGLSSILGIYDSKNVTLDNIRFVRKAKKDAEVGAGTLYVESVQGLRIDRCSFEGPTTTAIELWECEDASIKRTDISGATSGALSASYTQGLEMSASHISDCEGYPLLYLENSDKVSFKGTKFDNGQGGNFIEIYEESGSFDSIGFDTCVFTGNKVDYFSGTQLLPTTDNCQFNDNSFDENWESDSVAPASEDEYYYDNQGSDSEEAQGPQRYDHDSGLSFTYPAGWEMKEYPEQSRVGVFAPDGKSLVFFLTAYSIPAKDAIPANDQGNKKAKAALAAANAALAKLLKDQTGVALSLKADGEPYTDNDLLSADYKGGATKDDGEKAEARARLIVNEGKVEAMVGLAQDASSLEADSEIDGIFSSVEMSASGE